ncbi:MAG: oxidoreductase-like domain-containing protein [Telluria sp.]
MNPPVEPELEDCCRSGCSPCVFDLYAEAVERYEAWLAAQPKDVQEQEFNTAFPRPSGTRPNRGGSP